MCSKERRIRLTPPTTSCRMWHWRGNGGYFSKDGGGSRSDVSPRGGLPCLSGTIAVAGRLCMSGLRSIGGVECHAGPVRVSSVPPPGYSEGGDHLSRYPATLANVVSRDLADREPEEWSQCQQRAAEPGPEKLRDGLDVAA